jgi:hypothetical protein
MLSIILPMLFKLKMPWKTKVPLVFIFSMGLVVVRYLSPHLTIVVRSNLEKISLTESFVLS